AGLLRRRAHSARIPGVHNPGGRPAETGVLSAALSQPRKQAPNQQTAARSTHGSIGHSTALGGGSIRLKQHPLTRTFELGTVAVMATALPLVWGAAGSLAADYQDANHNVCEGTFTSSGCSTWASHVTGSYNVALGDAMMSSLTSAGALFSNTIGHGSPSAE